MGMVFDMCCVLWQYDECGVRGSCLFYDNKELALQLFAMCFSIKVISLIAMVLAVIVYKPPATVEPLVKEVSVTDPLGTLSSTVDSNGHAAPSIDDKPNGYGDKIPMTAAVVLAAEETNDAFEGGHSSVHL